ncbi:DUF6934 family protein [Algoriphagus sp. NG3]|uniref:DUF6934 family protein n=1 Tax=Algoriphagus sp. NG3 TaxID=3097546 RepID=UPI002A81C260|nr:hypothetical protein [Algoriphagus sp. NG3]WPR77504.1 hypothetical protein SLW71_09105 [Algoriphagus sp. NG3]
MNYEKYESVSSSRDSLEFEFTSIGSKGKFKKVVQFTQTSDSEIYNLGFGDKLENGEIDDLVRSDNGDRNKILATIVAIIYEFTSSYQDKLIFFSGSTEYRTRLYRMAISKNLEELNEDFEIFGINYLDGDYVSEVFKKGADYTGFIIKRKIH